MAKTLVGLEITEESVRGVEVTTGRSPSLIAAGEVPLPRDAARDSEVLDQDAVAVALRTLWIGAGFKGRRVTLGVGSRRILVREYTTQAMTPQLLRQALPYQVQDLLPVPVSQAVLDFYPLGQEGDQVTGLLVAAVSDNIEQLIATLKKAKLGVEAVDLIPFGLARIGKRIAQPGETVAMIHLGDHTSYVTVVTDGIPQFVRIIPVEIATAATQREQATTPSADLEVEEVLEPVGASGILPRRSGTRASMRGGSSAAPGVTDVVARLRSTLGFFQSREGAPNIAQAYVSGAGYIAPGIADAIGRAFDVPVAPIRLDQFVNTRSRTLTDELAFNAVATASVLFGEGAK